MNYFLGIDTSITATKALLMDATGRVLAAAAAEYGYEPPSPLDKVHICGGLLPSRAFAMCWQKPASQACKSAASA